MRALVAAILGLLVVNLFLAHGRRALSAESDAVRAEARELERAAERADRDAEHRRSVEELVASAERIVSVPRSISELRESLIDAERDLPIRRLSLDFRPEQQMPAGLGGSRVHATLQGSFDAIYDYLARIEDRRLPLNPESLTLRENDGEIIATVRWAARWPVDDGTGADSLTSQEVVQLNRWLRRDRERRPYRDPFTFSSRSVPPVPEANAPLPSETVDEASEAFVEGEVEPELPVLTGFVLARPELEPDVRRRVLAAVRFDDALRLVMVGDVLGVYVVEHIDARDSVTLRHTDTGERVRLTLD